MTTVIRRAGLLLAGSALLVPVLASPASAHVTAVPNETNSPYANTSLRVPHGCEGSATTTVRVQIPDGVESPKPEVVAGWEVEIVPADDAAADGGADGEDGDGHGAATAVAEVAWVGGNLPDNQFQEFGLNFRITDDAPEVLWFPTIQECEQGEHRWIEIPATVDEWGDLDEPAPYVINNLAAGGSGDDAPAADEAQGTDEAGDPQPAAATGEASSEGAGPLPVIALIAGLLGLAAGLAALLVTVRAGRRAAGATAPPAAGADT